MYKNLQEIKSALQFNIDDSLPSGSIKFDTLRLKKLLTAITAFVDEMKRFKALEKNAINNDITSRLKSGYQSMCDSWKSMPSSEITQLPPTIATQYNNLRKAFETCGLTELNEVLSDFKLKLVNLSEEIKTKVEALERIVKSNEMLSKISLDNDGRALLNIDVGKIYPLQTSFYDVPPVEAIKKLAGQFQTSAYNFAAFLGKAEERGIKQLADEDKSINEIKQNTERMRQRGRALCDRLTEQYSSNSAVALLYTEPSENDMRYKNAMYIGQLTDGIPNGIGRYSFSRSGEVFVGHVKDCNMLKGVYIHANGDKYDGEWKDDKYNGHGVYIFASGDKYDGEFKDNKYNGHGVLICANGDKYDGEFKDGKRNGHGVYIFANGDKHDGEFKHDNFNGHGVHIFVSGDKYDGEYKDNKYNGHGVFIYANGDKYDGEWKNDKYNGHGVLICANGDKYDGEWKEHKFYNGKVTMRTPNGVVIERQFADGEYVDQDKYKKYCHALEQEKRGDIIDGRFKYSFNDHRSAIEWAISIFKDLGNYLDSAIHLKNCQKEKQYQEALFYESSGHQIEKAVTVYKRLKGYKDSDTRRQQCKKNTHTVKHTLINLGLLFFSLSIAIGLIILNIIIGVKSLILIFAAVGIVDSVFYIANTFNKIDKGYNRKLYRSMVVNYSISKALFSAVIIYIGFTAFNEKNYFFVMAAGGCLYFIWTAEIMACKSFLTAVPHTTYGDNYSYSESKWRWLILVISIIDSLFLYGLDLVFTEFPVLNGWHSLWVVAIISFLYFTCSTALRILCDEERKRSFFWFFSIMIILITGSHNFSFFSNDLLSLALLALAMLCQRIGADLGDLLGGTIGYKGYKIH